ncbi:hypothetical protein AC249_AIPGENE10761 [Exaiptasia diaphana]|nr:hypothetical protein AC249_AIPGENE10761 [Exaiptasia diaphana]
MSRSSSRNLLLSAASTSTSQPSQIAKNEQLKSVKNLYSQSLAISSASTQAAQSHGVFSGASIKSIQDFQFQVFDGPVKIIQQSKKKLKNGRIPLGLTSRVAHWKSEEWQKFAYSASELILAGLLPPADYHLWQLAVRMTQLIFNHRSQWSHEDVLLFSNLANRYIILNEEQQGITACRITVHNLQHISEDALRFSHPDNYWCFPFERAVQRYLVQKQNNKGKFLMSNLTSKSGVLIGGMLSNDVLLSEEEMDLIKHSLSPSLSVPEVGFRYRAFWKPMPSPNGMLFRKNECVILKDDDGSDDEVVCQVEYYLCVQVDNSFVKFVKVSAYSAELDEESNTLYDPYSGGMFIDTTNVKTLLAPATSIDRKVILYNCNDDAHPNRGIVVDFQREVMAITYSDFQVPFYPKCEDMMLIKGDGPDPWLTKVLRVTV